MPNPSETAGEPAAVPPPTPGQRVYWNGGDDFVQNRHADLDPNRDEAREAARDMAREDGDYDNCEPTL